MVDCNRIQVPAHRSSGSDLDIRINDIVCEERELRRLSGKVAIVTAAGSGIGQASARRMAAEGASVMVTDIRITRAEETVGLIRENGGIADAMAVDVESEAAISFMVDQTIMRFGRLDILHNNAALLDPHLSPMDVSVLTIPAEVWDRVMAANVRSVMLGCKYAIPGMLKGGGGSIVNTSSTMGLTGDCGMYPTAPRRLRSYSSQKMWRRTSASRRFAAMRSHQALFCRHLSRRRCLPSFGRFMRRGV
jgi:NAD(P)-dependent dehydrogenase (short-subunit alcohol dehydrogenase family)